MSTKVVHCKKEPYDIYIGRPSPWGNSYSHKEGTLAKFLVSSRKEAVQKFEADVRNNPELIARIKQELKDKILGCWCKPLMCHGDVLAKIADEE